MAVMPRSRLKAAYKDRVNFEPVRDVMGTSRNATSHFVTLRLEGERPAREILQGFFRRALRAAPPAIAGTGTGLAPPRLERSTALH